MPIASKLYKMFIYIDGFLLPIKSHDSLITWSFKITWQTNIIISSLPQCLWLPNLAKAYLPWWVPADKFTLFFVTWSYQITRHLKPLYLYYHNAYGTILDKLVTCQEGLPPTILLHSLVTWSCEITWETKAIIPSLPKHLWPQNYAGWWLTLSAFYP